MSRQQLAEDIHAARDYIAVHGWCQGDLEKPDGTVCLMGAYKAVLGQSLEDTRSRDNALEQFLEEGVAQALGKTSDQIIDESYYYAVNKMEGDTLAPIAYYNDVKLKTTQEVLDFLDKQAIRAEELV